MTELQLNNRIVVEWPIDNPLPKIGDTFSAGDLGAAIVTRTAVTNVPLSFNEYPLKRVEFTIFRRIENE